MNKDRLQDLESKYWEGKSSLNDEQYLKAQKNDPYFKGLKAVKEEQLEWSFDDFLHQTEQAKKEKKPVHRYISKLIWKYVGVAAALLVIGFLFWNNRDIEPKVTEDENLYVLQDVEKDTSTRFPSTPYKISDQENEEGAPAELLRIAEQKMEEKEVAPVEQVVVETGEAYVMVNGKPVHDEQEVEQIILASLQLMASNFQEGRQAVEKIRYIRVEL